MRVIIAGSNDFKNKEYFMAKLKEIFMQLKKEGFYEDKKYIRIVSGNFNAVEKFAIEYAHDWWRINYIKIVDPSGEDDSSRMKRFAAMVEHAKQENGALIIFLSENDAVGKQMVELSNKELVKNIVVNV